MTTSPEGTRVRTRSSSDSVPPVADSIRMMKEALAASKKQRKNGRDEEHRGDAESEVGATSPIREDDRETPEYAAVQVWDDFLSEENKELRETQFTDRVYCLLP